MDEAQQQYNAFEDVVTIGALSNGFFNKIANLLEFSSRVFAAFAVAYAKHIIIPEDDTTLLAESRKIRQPEFQQAFELGCKSRAEYERNLQNLNELIVGSAYTDSEFVGLAIKVIKSPWFGGFARVRKEDIHDPSVNYDQVASFWHDLAIHPDLRKAAIIAMCEECQAIFSRRCKVLPLIEFRRMLLFELCPYWEDELALFELSHVYGAMRYGRPVDDGDDSKRKLQLVGRSNNWDCLNWYTSMPLCIYRDLVARVVLTATLLMVECATNTEDPTEITRTLPKYGFPLRSSMLHLATLYTSNKYRRLNFEEELLDPQFWKDKRPIEDLDPDTYEPLNITSSGREEDDISKTNIMTKSGPPYYLTESCFYVDCSVMSLELDFLYYFDHGQSIFGVMLCPGCMDPLMKSRLMALDSRQQQMERGRIISMGPIFFMPYLTLTIRRDRIVDDALDKLVLAQGWENGDRLKSPLKIQFEGEEGIDEGGVTKEFFQLLIEQLINPDYGMFILVGAQDLYYFMPDGYGTMLQFELIGIILGLAVYNRVILNIHFPHFIYKKLLCCVSDIKNFKLGPTNSPPVQPTRNLEISSRILSGLSVPEDEHFDTSDSSYAQASAMTPYQIVKAMATDLPPYKPSIEDLQELYPDTARGLRQLLMMSDAETVDNLMLTFSVTIERFGEHVEVPLLMADGENSYPPDKPVTMDNRSEYITAVLNHHLNFSVNKEFSAFYKGFHRCCGGPALTRLTPNDLHLLICGAPGDLDFQRLKAGAKYVDGYAEDSEVIRWFWEVIDRFDQEDKKKLLFFMTGSDRTPVGGLESLELTISKAGGDLDRLPTAHTCFNHILLPPYESLEALERCLRKAIEYRHGFGLR